MDRELIAWLYNQFMDIKTRSESITNSINHFPISKLDNDSKDMKQLIDSIESDANNLLTNIKSIKELIY